MDTLRDLNHHPDTFSPDHLQCQRIARPALLHPKQGKRRKALMLEISIHSLPAPPPSHLTGYRQGAGNNSGREISGNQQILLERHTADPVVQRFQEAWRVIDETKSSGHCELQDKPLLTAGVGKWWWGRPITLPLLCSWARPGLPPFTAPSFTSIHHFIICPNELEVDGKERALWMTNKDIVFSLSPMCGISSSLFHL